MATRPATAPEAAPSTVGLPRVIHSVNIQPSAAAAAPVLVATNALTAEAVGLERAAGVEAEPAEPQQARAHHGHGQVVRLHRLMPVALAPAEHDRAHQRRDARGDVHDGAAREVERALALQPAAVAPHPVGERVVDERRPQQGEQQERRELHALGERAGDQRRRDDREHHLEQHERLVRDRLRVGVERLDADAAQADPLQPADDAALVGAEGQAVAPQDPLDRDQRHDDEALHQRGEHVLLAHHAAVEERQPRRRHQQHQRRGRQHPGGVALVDLRGGAGAAAGAPVRRAPGRPARARRAAGGRRGLSADATDSVAEHDQHRECESAAASRCPPGSS